MELGGSGSSERGIVGCDGVAESGAQDFVVTQGGVPGTAG